MAPVVCVQAPCECPACGRMSSSAVITVSQRPMKFLAFYSHGDESNGGADGPHCKVYPPAISFRFFMGS